VRNEGVVKREQATITEKTRAKKAIGRRLKKLEGVFADWEDQTIEESENFTAQCRARTDEWEERAEVLVDAKQRSQSVAKEIKGTEGELGPLKKSRDQALNTYEKEAARFKTLKAERAKMFDGRPTGEVRSELNKNQVAAQKAHGEAQQWLSKANNAHSNSQTLAKEAREQLASAKKEKEDSKKRLEKGCKKAGVKLEEVSEGLKIGDEWVEAEEKRLADIRGALAEAKVVRAERVKALEAHLKTNAPDEAREDLEGSHKKVSAALDAAADERAEVEGALRQDDEARNAIKNIESELTNRRKQAEVWARLNDLIGSHMGDKFRTFAQSLTLDWLVGLANERLKDLVPRFELERAAGGELAIQVIDHDMGDEVRGVHNLSGGEKFLVSLSLALALAGISSGQGIRVDSLFIDEGFGSLDNNCLNMAISALEALQATGRKVGVISHVDELKERIGVQVQVTPSGGGRSTVEVLAR
jgi:exonuclease SbcC